MSDPKLASLIPVSLRFRTWLTARSLQFALWLMGDCPSRRLLLWYLDMYVRAIETPRWAKQSAEMFDEIYFPANVPRKHL